MRSCDVCGKDVNIYPIMHYCNSCGKEYCMMCMGGLEIISVCSEDYMWSLRKCDKCGGKVMTMSTSFERHFRSYSYGDNMPLSLDDYERQQALRTEYYENINKQNEELRRQYR
jgi:hypothetical protein